MLFIDMPVAAALICINHNRPWWSSCHDDRRVSARF